MIDTTRKAIAHRQYTPSPKTSFGSDPKVASEIKKLIRTAKAITNKKTKI